MNDKPFIATPDNISEELKKRIVIIQKLMVEVQNKLSLVLLNCGTTTIKKLLENIIASCDNCLSKTEENKK